jgi:hypothetical protein
MIDRNHPFFFNGFSSTGPKRMDLISVICLATDLTRTSGQAHFSSDSPSQLAIVFLLQAAGTKSH